MSSLYVQKVAEFITRALHEINISCLIYLDDLFFILPNHTSAQQKFSQAMKMLNDLGLPINKSKLIPPTTQAIWLGVHFDVLKNTISIPQNKVQQLLDIISPLRTATSLTRREAQSILGRMAHLARVVHPACLFMCRILAELRQAKADTIHVTPAVRADLNWFYIYFTRHNTTAIIPSITVPMVIEADACPHGAGAWSSAGDCYSYSFSHKTSQGHAICQLEALNYLVAIRSFASDLPAGTRIEVVGDNKGAISALSSGCVCDMILASIACAIWFHAASRDLTVLFTHKPREQIAGADALSRAGISSHHAKKAQNFVESLSLKRLYPPSAFSNYQKFF